MEKRTKVILIIFIILGSGISIFILSRLGFFFTSGGRYDDSKLDYMSVPWKNMSDINSWNEGYSESDDCPWGFEHNGLDFFFNDSVPVIAMAPGLVESIEFVDTEADENRYHIRVNIRFNREVVLGYGFEPWTGDKEKAEKQLDDLEIQEGDWVKKGEKIADFVAYDDSAHIHFGLNLNNEAVCPKDYFSEEGYEEMMDLIHKYHPDWKLCYN